jgi:hypothetical protein
MVFALFLFAYLASELAMSTYPTTIYCQSTTNTTFLSNSLITCQAIDYGFNVRPQKRGT